MPEENLYDKLRLECHHKSQDCSAMRYIFEQRAKRLNWRVTLIKAFGYGLDNTMLKDLIVIAVPVSCIQFAISLWAIIYNWDGELAYSYEGIQSYNPLYSQYHELASYPPNNFDDLKQKFDLINIEMSFRSQQDASHNIAEWENRMGMRYSLREHQVACVGCKKTPLSLDSTDCDVCGKFSFRYKYF